MTTVAAVVRCSSVLRHIHTTVRTIQGQRRAPDLVVLTVDPSIDTAVADWVEAYASMVGAAVARIVAPTPGAAWNQAMSASGSDLVMCMDAGDELEPDFLERSFAALDSDGGALAVTGVLEWGEGGRRRLIPPPPSDLEALAESVHYARRPMVIRRDVWRALEGFDDQLGTLEDLDFMFRALQGGETISAVADALVVRGRRYDAAYRRDWTARSEASARLVEKHPGLLATAAVLAQRNRSREVLMAQHQRLRDRYEAACSEIDAVEGRIHADPAARAAFAADEILPSLVERTTPISRDWGCERGNPLDRHYIEGFMERHSADVAGVVLEVDNPDYTIRYGAGKVTRSDVVDVEPDNSKATVITDLRFAANIASNTYDCVILTQTLHIIDDIAAVIAECERILSPGGVLLATLPCSSRVCLEYGYNGDFWRVTLAGARRLFAAAFPHASLEVEARGNALAVTAFTYGLAEQEIAVADLAANDPFMPLVVTVRAVKPLKAGGRPASRIESHVAGRANTGAVLLYHRVATPASDVHHLSVSPEAFRTQMEALATEFRPMALTDLLACADRGDIPDRAVAVTFDDGYRDNLTVASPILEEMGVPATFFIATHGLPEPALFWWDELEHLLLSPAADLPPGLSLDLPGGTKEFVTATAADRMATHGKVWRLVQSLARSPQDEVLAQVRQWAAGSPPTGAPRLTSAEAVELAGRPGHVLGGHTVRHLLLPDQPVDVQAGEIADGKADLEDLVGGPVTDFAYPFGSCTPETVKCVVEAGFSSGLTCEPVALRPATDPWRQPRLEVTRYLGDDFATALSAILASSC